MKNNYFLKAAFTFILCGLFSMSYAADWYISATTGNDATGDGSMALPWASFSKAQTMATAGDIINVSGMIDMWSDPANTTFTALASGNSTTNKTGITIAKSLTIQGTSSANDGFTGTNETNTTRFFQLSAAYTLTLKNIKFANGAIISTLTTLSYGGGAILITNGNIMAENVVFDNNIVSGHSGITGAAIAVNGSSNAGTYFKKCTFTNNKADKAGAFYIQTWGGGTAPARSIIQFESCSFVGNEAKNTGGSALFVRSASEYTTFNAINCTFSKNKVVTASNGGTINLGAKAMRYTNMNIINCTVTENTTAGSNGNGAGLNYVNTGNNNIGNLYIKNSIIENNTTTTGVYSDLNLSAASPTVPETGTSTTVPGYIKIENSFIGAHVSDNTRVPTGNISSSMVGYLTTISTTNDLKAGLAPFNATTNSFSLYAGSAAIPYGNSAFLTGLTPTVTTDQLGNVRTVALTNYAGAWESTPLATTTPDAPTALVATAGNGQVSLVFKSAATGGSNVTNYKYAVNDGAYVVLDPAITVGPIVITGLTNDVAYTVKLKAVNANGDSPESIASNSVTPTIVSGLNNALNNVITVLKNSNNQIVIKNSSTKSGSVIICNTLGQIILSTTLNGTATTINKSLNSGVYLVLVNIDGKSKSTKIIL